MNTKELLTQAKNILTEIVERYELPFALQDRITEWEISVADLSKPASEDAWLVEANKQFDAALAAYRKALGKELPAGEFYEITQKFDAHLRARPAPEGFVLVPVEPTEAMNRVMYDEDWTWPDLLAAAESITEDEYNTLNSMLNAAKESGK